MTQACSLRLCHGHSLDLETVKRESLADPYYGPETNPAICFACRVLADVSAEKQSDSSLISFALLLNMTALVPAIALVQEPR